MWQKKHFSKIVNSLVVLAIPVFIAAISSLVAQQTIARAFSRPAQKTGQQFMAAFGCVTGTAIAGACSEKDAHVAGVSTTVKKPGKAANSKTTDSSNSTAKTAPKTTPSAPTNTTSSGALQVFDLANWSSWTSPEVLASPPNGELQRYTASSQNIRYEGGNLIIEAHGNANGNITSGRLFSGSKWRMGGNRFGRIDVTAKLPGFRGSWPAIWLFDKDVASGTAPEIDIMELVGADPTEINSTFHDQKYNPINGNERSGQLIVPTATSAFHTYSLIWLPNYVETQVDGRKIKSVSAADDPSNPFYTTSMGLVLNLAVGGSWGGYKGVDYAAIEGSRMEISKITFQNWQ